LARVDLVVTSRAAEPAEPEAPIQLIVRDLTTGGSTPILRTVKTWNETVRLELPASGSWELRIEAEGHWAPSELLNLRPNQESRIVVDLWPTGVFVGQVQSSSLIDLTEDALQLRIERPPGPSSIDAPPPTLLPCDLVEASEVFHCEAPVGPLDLVFRLDDHAPRYLWGVEISEREPLDVGRLRFTPGASLAGWVALEDESLVAGKGRARLEPLAGPGGTVTERQRLDNAAVETPIGERGFFQVDDLGPGTYRLTLTYPGKAPTIIQPVRLEEGTETRVRDVVVFQPTFPLTLRLDPPADWRDQPWTVRVSESPSGGSHRSDAIFEGAASQEGVVRIDGQAPGTYWIEVRDSTGNLFFLDPNLPITSAEDGEQLVVLDLIAVEGRASLGGDEPFVGTLWFGGRRGAPGVEVETNEGGEFAAVLPREGRWRVDLQGIVEVDGETESLETRSAVEVRRDRAVDLEIPDTSVFGWVVDGAGTPVAGATVSWTTETASFRTESDRDGSFRLRGLDPGAARIDATVSSHVDGRRASAAETAELVEDRDTGPLELVLIDNTELAGVVRSAFGPVAGAQVVIGTTSTTIDATDVAQTDLEGKFTVRVPEGFDSFRAVVAPPGHGLDVFEVRRSAGELVLEVERWSGTLSAAVGSPAELRDRNRLVVLLKGGHPIPTAVLTSWAATQGIRGYEGGRLYVPGLAPGEYTLCVGAVETLLLDGLDVWIDAARCDSGTLTPGETLRLDVASSAQS
jgi:hypothetical protein